MEKQLSEIVEDLYAIGTVINVYEIFAGFTNRGFGIRTRKGSDSNTYFVRQYKDGVTLKEIRTRAYQPRHREWIAHLCWRGDGPERRNPGSDVLNGGFIEAPHIVNLKVEKNMEDTS